MTTYPFQYVNRRGSAAITSTGVNVTATNAVYTFPNHAFVNAWYRGTLYIDLAQQVPSGTTGTFPVLFETNGVTQAVTKYGGEALTVADLPGTGVYEFWFDRATNTLQILTGVV